MNVAAGSPWEETAHFVIDAGTWAPSVHNTQPWWFGVRSSAVTVHADVERRLNVADPDGREMLISCGAALYTLRVAVRRLGITPQVHLLPDPESPALIANVAVGAAAPVTDDEIRMYDQIRRRRTHRGGFHPEPLPSGLLQALRINAEAEDVRLRIVAEPRARIALAALTEVGEQTHRQNPEYVAEMARWAPRPGSDRQDGVHEDAYPREAERTDPHFAARDFARGHGWGLTDDERYGATGVVALLTTNTDERADWVNAGQGLQRVLLRAAENDVSAAFHTQALEVAELREFVRGRFCDGAWPQMIMRLGVADRQIGSVRRSAQDVTRPDL